MHFGKLKLVFQIYLCLIKYPIFFLRWTSATVLEHLGDIEVCHHPFDVENFYPSISMKLFTDSVKYAKNLIEITNQDLAFLIQATKSLLSQKSEPWVKKSGTKNFDFPMGC